MTAKTRTLSRFAATLLLLFGVACEGGAERFEQAAFDRFAAEHWRSTIFDGECTGLEFDRAAPIYVAADTPSYEVSMLDFSQLAGLDLRAAALEDGGLQQIKNLGTPLTDFVHVDIGKLPGAKEAQSTGPIEEWKASDGYLLRFSNRLRYNGRVYQQMWIKGPYYSSGVRVGFEFDDDGTLMTSLRQGAHCDDWG